MKIINSIRNYILEDEFKFIFRNKTLDIINYDAVLSVSSTVIKIKYYDGIIVVSGNHLVISRLLNDELLIDGMISNIEIR